MVRWNTLAAGVAVVLGAAFVTGASSLPPKPFDGLAKEDPIKDMPIRGQKIGFFNMAKVMRESRRAHTGVQRLVARRDRMSKNLVGMREMFKELQSAPKDPNRKRQEQTDHEMLLLSRQMEDMDHEVNKLLNNQASMIIVELYNEIHALTAEIAHDRGLSAVFAYPDAVTPEEQESPLVKELKLKPPAAQPFYLDPTVDYTDDLVERLNAKFTAETGDN